MFKHTDIPGLLAQIEKDLSIALSESCKELSMSFKVGIDQIPEYEFYKKDSMVKRKN